MSNESSNDSLFGSLLWLGAFAVLFVGWVMNLVDIVGMESVWSGLGVLRVIGFFIPWLGALLGFIT